jgi:hypothetical protein
MKAAFDVSKNSAEINGLAPLVRGTAGWRKA